MSKWKFKCYAAENGEVDFDEWVENLPLGAQARLDKILEHFRDLPHTEWGSNYIEKLVGFDGIYEVKFTVQNIQYRPLGFFGPSKNEFTFLIGAREVGNKFSPKSAPTLAEERKEIILKDNSRAYECNF